jgi:drug/metabolite transporter (DMT)-like permease
MDTIGGLGLVTALSPQPSSGFGPLRGLVQMESYLYVFGALALTVYGQILIKSRILHYAASRTTVDYRAFLLWMFFDPWIISVFVSAVVAAAFWMLALRNADLSLLYPFMALTFVLVPLFASLFFGEKVNTLQVLGLLMIVGGVSLATIAR